MKTFGSSVNAALTSGSLAIVQLVHMAFSTGEVFLNTSTWNLDYDGNTYRGAYGLGTISAVTDKPGEIQGLTLELFADAAHVSLALDDAGVVQGTVCTIRTAIIETTNYTVLDAPVEWLGTLDTMSIAEDGEKAVIRVSAESRGVDLLRGNPWTYSNPEQRILSASDGSFRFIVDQIDKRIVWPAKAFFYQ
jgi:hypothetical protein